MPHFIYLMSETSKMKDKCPSTATLQAPTIHGYRRWMTQHLGETKAGERLPALSREEERAGSVSRCLKQSPHPSCASELLRSWASLPEEPEAQPAAPDLRLPLLPRATGRHRSARSRRAHRFLPSAARPAPAPRRWERGTGGGRAEPRRAGPGREGRAPPHTHTSAPLCANSPGPAVGRPHTQTHTAAPGSAAPTRPAPGPARLPLRPSHCAVGARCRGGVQPAQRSRPAPARPLTSESPPGVGGSLRGLLGFRRRGTLPVTSSRSAGRGTVLVTSSRRKARATRVPWERASAFLGSERWGRLGWKRVLSSARGVTQRYHCNAKPRPYCRVHASLKYPQGWGLRRSPEQLCPVLH